MNIYMGYHNHRVKLYLKETKSMIKDLTTLGKRRKEKKPTVKSTDPTMVARATTYSGKLVRIVQVFSEVAGAI